ncbi:UNVERIFIED_CONTAM: hypothetical protein GTU68_066847, partial [Idotea baltica]|nr:hypothetical protein [Idotea baltica]
GDLIPWSLAAQYLNPKLTKLRGARVVRVATHPDYQSMGYGSRAVQLLKEYYGGRFIPLDEATKKEEEEEEEEEGEEEDALIGPLPVTAPLLRKLGERPPESVDYVGVSYGITEPLFRFWRKADFMPVHISHKRNKTTGEHNCVMVHPMCDPGFSLAPTP